MSDPERTTGPAPARRPRFGASGQASRQALRSGLLDAMREHLRHSDWSAVTMTDIAAAAGVSRQTVYNEFGSRQGLATAYALRLIDEFCAAVDTAVEDNVGRIRDALGEAHRAFFALAAADPLVQSLLSGRAKPDLLRLITTDAAPLILHATGTLADTLHRSWIGAPYDEARRVASSIGRMALSYIAMPPEDDSDVADHLARLFEPVIASVARSAA
ncbi:TetR/AcrR family transcriptional regulator [Williamsia serinedens]|uniref:Transcriptional regulator, TetR family n=1 Tax=Williamsia serinedens TaxID=391736 RepID=A0ABT1H2G0_9NOCA|nr:TetR family transcriptional regulator [Williamsia serinedens]MCP2161326.1 transcriptional regulator, TetR family [Williamsia serinedens]